jgi:uncharacterized protein with PhoU and TrkA domain
MTEVERVKYTPASVRETLIMMKDISELMIDLAYSALLLNSHHLAEEVLMLEDRMDHLHTEFELLVLSVKVVSQDVRGLLGLIRMGVVTERIADAAAEIAEVVIRSGEPHPVLTMVIQDAEETVERVVVGEGSPIVGKTLKAAKIPEETGMWVLIVRRGDRWIRPKPSTILNAGDVIIAAGYAEGEDILKKLLNSEEN